MEKGFEEKVKKMNVKELARFLERGGVYAFLAASEGLERFEKGDPEIGKNFLISVLQAKIERTLENEGREIKKIAAEILKEKFFDEKSALAIIECEELKKEEREEVAKKYILLGGKDRYLLKRIAESNLSQETKNLAAEKIIQFEPTKDELISIFLETTNLTQERILELLLEEELEKEDYCYLIMNCQPDIAEKFFEKMKRAKEIKNLGEEDLEDLRLSENQKISSWATKKLIKKLEEKKKKLKEKMKSVKDWFEKEIIWGDIEETKEKIEFLKKELEGEKKIKTEVDSLALASNFFYFYNEVIYEVYPPPLPRKRI